MPNDKLELYISEVVLDEIDGASTPKKIQLLQLINTHQPRSLMLNPAVQELANAYLVQKLLSPQADYDAQHIAVATVPQLDVVVSWNLRHIANIHRQQRVQTFNQANGYPKFLQMITPIEVIYDE